MKDSLNNFSHNEPRNKYKRRQLARFVCGKKRQARRNARAWVRSLPPELETNHTSKEAVESFDESTPEGENSEHEVSVAGRVMVFRLMGKASFVKIKDRDGVIQLYFARDGLPEGVYNDWFKNFST